ncbi:hypothetical protein [Sinosporangium siamense]|uniref:Uncharacterized protein n=1 Tax=Sinosporangium siamense TaxID=1367973 RepID=A0A919RFQ0_9ACTN|nr:hypothetical protein [Sinosporangium siamense]GII93051.1 hypothetical protein Ssi02_32820 [Sinosporangium siamense]
MGYELRVERESPLPYAELAGAVLAVGFELHGSAEAGEVVARHGQAAHVVGSWNGALRGQPGSDWQVAQLARLAKALGGRLTGEDGELYVVRDGIVEQVSGNSVFALGKLDEILGEGPTAWPNV